MYGVEEINVEEAEEPWDVGEDIEDDTRFVNDNVGVDTVEEVTEEVDEEIVEGVVDEKEGLEERDEGDCDELLELEITAQFSNVTLIMPIDGTYTQVK